MLLSIIIPLYNESATIEELEKRLSHHLERLGEPFEIILINDGSFDSTGEVIDRLAQKDNRYRAIHLKRNFGQTAAIMAGIDYAQGEIIITMDGDLQNDPADISRLLGKLQEGYEVCSGWRKERKDRLFTRVVPSKIANALISAISGVKLKDYGCTLKAYRREVISGIKLYGEMHRFIPIYASWQGARVAEIPVTHHPRKHGSSHYGLNRTFKVVLDLIVVKFLASYSQKPIYVFGGFGLVNFFLSILCFGMMIYYKFWGGKSFIETPIPFLVVLFFLMGFLSILMGLIAELLMRTYYESQNKPNYLVGKISSYKSHSRTKCEHADAQDR
ncbi:MAG: glycosyltransferase [Chitinivibrionales bacterium]|nr:glycosyltransferase [Chitinivibrionales bacterium]